MCISVDQMTIRELQAEVAGLKRWIKDTKVEDRKRYYEARLSSLEPYLAERIAAEEAEQRKLSMQEVPTQEMERVDA